MEPESDEPLIIAASCRTSHGGRVVPGMQLALHAAISPLFGFEREKYACDGKDRKKHEKNNGDHSASSSGLENAPFGCGSFVSAEQRTEKAPKFGVKAIRPHKLLGITTNLAPDGANLPATSRML